MRKILGITMGDPAGVGPEITVKALQDPVKCGRKLQAPGRGRRGYLRKSLRVCGCKMHHSSRGRPQARGLYEHGTIDILDLGLLRPEDLAIGQVSAAAGDKAFRYVRKVIELRHGRQGGCHRHEPLEQKQAMNLAGHHFSGHTGNLRPLHRHRTLHDDACPQ